MLPIYTRQVSRFELILRGGHVIDPANGRDGVMDVAVEDGRIAKVAPEIEDAADTVLDVAGLYVTPGLIDIHVHVYPRRGDNGPTWQAAIVPDAHSFRAGVTTFVDAGTSGAEDFADFKLNWIDQSQTRVLAWLNIAAAGMGDAEQDPAQFDVQRAVDTQAAHADAIVGFKTAHFWTRDPWDEAHPDPWASVDAAVAAGERADRPVMVDFWPRPPERSYQDLILKHMRSGDVHTHVFAQQFPIVHADGRVQDHMWQARERGVLFDVGHGGASFWFRNAAPAYAAGFAPDSISTDLHLGSLNGAALDTLHTVSKCVAFGMPLNEAIYRATVTPARAIRRQDLGTLSEGAEADVAVLRWIDQPRGYADCGRARLVGPGELECMLTLRGGGIVWDPSGIGMPVWQEAPAAYWNVPALQR
jgi:dihydroorotase